MVAARDLASPADEAHEILFGHDSLRTVRRQLDAPETVTALVDIAHSAESR